MRSGPSCFGVEYGPLVTAKDGYGKDQKVSGGKDWRCTTKPGKIYIHLFKWPDGRFEVDGLKTTVTKAYLLADPATALDVAQKDGHLSVSLPKTAPDPIVSVLCLETQAN